MPCAGEVPAGERMRDRKDEIRLLLARAQAGDRAARERLIESNLRLVQSVARRFAGRAETDDLFQVGCIGLMQAIDRFDLSYDVAFSTYAVPLILAEIHRFLRENRPVKVSRHGLDLARRAHEARAALEAELGRSPTPQEIGDRVGVPREEVVLALDAVAAPASLDAPLGTGDGETGSARLEQLRSPIGAPEEEVIDGIALRTALAGLDRFERRVLLLRFVREMRQVDVAEELGVSQAHISRVEKRILVKVREFLTR